MIQMIERGSVTDLCRPHRPIEALRAHPGFGDQISLSPPQEHP
jgi:hypothetical protein